VVSRRAARIEEHTTKWTPHKQDVEEDGGHASKVAHLEVILLLTDKGVVDRGVVESFVGIGLKVDDSDLALSVAHLGDPTARGEGEARGPTVRHAWGWWDWTGDHPGRCHAFLLLDDRRLVRLSLLLRRRAHGSWGALSKGGSANDGLGLANKMEGLVRVVQRVGRRRSHEHGLARGGPQVASHQCVSDGKGDL
jgi:hypothetical protein